MRVARQPTVSTTTFRNFALLHPPPCFGWSFWRHDGKTQQPMAEKPLVCRVPCLFTTYIHSKGTGALSDERTSTFAVYRSYYRVSLAILAIVVATPSASLVTCIPRSGFYPALRVQSSPPPLQRVLRFLLPFFFVPLFFSLWCFASQNRVSLPCLPGVALRARRGKCLYKLKF